MEGWVAAVRAGRILFEVEGLTLAEAQKALSLAAHKLCLRSTFIQRVPTGSPASVMSTAALSSKRI